MTVLQILSKKSIINTNFCQRIQKKDATELLKYLLEVKNSNQEMRWSVTRNNGFNMPKIPCQNNRKTKDLYSRLLITCHNIMTLTRKGTSRSMGPISIHSSGSICSNLVPRLKERKEKSNILQNKGISTLQFIESSQNGVSKLKFDPS